MTIDTQDLIDAVQANLTPDLLSPQERARLEPFDHFTTGHCAVAAEALLHLVRRYRPTWQPSQFAQPTARPQPAPSRGSRASTRPRTGVPTGMSLARLSRPNTPG